MGKGTIFILTILSVSILCAVGGKMISLGQEMQMKPEEIDAKGMSIHRKKAMEIIHRDLLNQFGDKNTYIMIRGVKGTQHIVAGTLYKLEFLIGETACGDELTLNYLTQCLQRVHTYEVSILEQLWENRIEVLECKRIMSKEIDRSDLNMRERFNKFKVNFYRTYTVLDEEKRYEIFKKNMIEAQVLQLIDIGTAEFGETRFADLRDDEFANWVGEKMNTDGHVETVDENLIHNTTDVPESFDWQSHGAVTNVKNQKGCGSCWAFSTTGNIEGLWKIKKGNLYSLSEKQLIDCDTDNHGCNGGLPSKACKTFARMGGIEREIDYPYKAESGPCKFNCNKHKCVVKISGGIGLKSDESYMKIWLYHNCPISIAVNAITMKYYQGGISHPSELICDPNHLNHAVLATGYGVENDKLYWSIKNSWGSSWGENGYIRLYRGSGVCGVNLLPTSAVL